MKLVLLLAGSLLAALMTASCGLKINMPSLSDGGSGASLAALELGR